MEKRFLVGLKNMARDEMQNSTWQVRTSSHEVPCMPCIAGKHMRSQTPAWKFPMDNAPRRLPKGNGEATWMPSHFLRAPSRISTAPQTETCATQSKSVSVLMPMRNGRHILCLQSCGCTWVACPMPKGSHAPGRELPSSQMRPERFERPTF